MKKLPFLVLLSGIAIQLAGFLGEHAEEIPHVMKIIAPTYCRAKGGIDTLLKNRSLVNTNEGFQEISHFLILDAYAINHLPRNLKTDFKIASLMCMGETRQENTPHGDVLFLPDDIRYRISSMTNRLVDSVGRVQGSLEFHYHLASLQESVAELKRPNLLRFCFGMFIVGSIVDVLAFYLDRAEKAETVASQSEAKSGEPPKKEDQKQPPA